MTRVRGFRYVGAGQKSFAFCVKGLDETMDEPRPNRVETWLRERRRNRYLFVAGLLIALFLLDSLVQGIVVGLGHRRAEAYVTTAVLKRLFSPAPVPFVAPPPPPGGWQPWSQGADSLLGWTNRPNALEVVFSESGAPRTRFTNDQGIFAIGPAPTHYVPDKPADVFRVVVLGASSTAGMGADRPEQSIPAYLARALERDLAAHPGSPYRRIEVINAARLGYTSGQEYLYLLSDLLQFHPDLVIACDGVSDALNIRRDAAYIGSYRNAVEAASDRRLEKSYAASGLAILWLQKAASASLKRLDRFALPDLAHQLIASAIPAGRGRADDAPLGAEVIERAARFFVENRERMVFLGRQNGFAFASVLLPMPSSVRADQLIEGSAGGTFAPADRTVGDAFYAAVIPGLAARHFEQAGACFDDTLTAALAPVQERIFYNPTHFNGRGSELVADHVFQILERCGQLPR